MFPPAEHDEITTALGYADQQLEAIRASIYGLTEAQARDTPCRSELSILGILKHVTWVMENVVSRVNDGPQLGPLSEADFESFGDGFRPDADAVDAILQRFDAARATYLTALGSVDPDAQTTEPPAPWEGRMQPTPIRWRYALVHQVEELARHAGHADIIREQLDGALVGQLRLTVAGAPANPPWFTPFEAQPGTITA